MDFDRPYCPTLLCPTGTPPGFHFNIGSLSFAGGYTVAQLARALEPMPGSDLTVVPLQGNWADGGLHLQNDQVCRDAATQLGARALSLPAPMVVEPQAGHQD